MKIVKILDMEIFKFQDSYTKLEYKPLIVILLSYLTVPISSETIYGFFLMVSNRAREKEYLLHDAIEPVVVDAATSV